jgi:O-antigen/teichoic acid export membrane protein
MGSKGDPMNDPTTGPAGASELPPSPRASGETSRATFFRQSGWMVFATTLSGFFFYAVHFFAGRRMFTDEYGVFNTLLQVLNQMAIPAVGLQTIFVQQAALAESEAHRRELAGAVRSVLKAAFFFWLATAVVVFLFRNRLLADYKVQNPVALWATLALGLVSLWHPVMAGMLQGRQNFLWLGLIPVASASSRLVLVAVIVWLLHGQAAGAVIGVFLSMLTALGLGVWQTLPLWRGEASSFLWTPWLKKVLPLTLGMGSSTFMFTIDMLAVQRFLPESGIYGAAGMIGRALVFLVAPLTMVMFPKIVRAAAKAERTDVLMQALGATALMAVCAAVFCTFWPDLPIRIVQGEKYLAAAPLVRWFAWCVLPLMVSTVLVNNLMARERYDAVPWLVAVAALYGVALWQPSFHASHTRVIQTLGLFALLYFGVCLFFTWKKKPARLVPGGPLPTAV